MEGFGDKLADDEVAALTTYLRNTWGNRGVAVTADQAPGGWRTGGTQRALNSDSGWNVRPWQRQYVKLSGSGTTSADKSMQ